MKKVVYRSGDRGYADNGWLKAKHSFSFAAYDDPSKVHFGLLRVLNDDSIAPSMGFGMHPHDNMEIVTIPLHGAIKHRDNMGHEGIINAGDVQIMSAGKGIMHSEFNASSTEFLNLFQIWVFPKLRNITPRYDQKTFTPETRQGVFQLLVSPGKEDGTLWINQDAWFSLGDFKAGEQVTYSPKLNTNGAYMMVVKGMVKVDGETLNERDAIGIWEADKLDIQVAEDAQLLVLDVPMN